jgi:hypothetical protein
MIDIVLNPFDLVYDAGVITRVEKDGLLNVIKIINQDGITWYVETPDRDEWNILQVENLPEDWKQLEYYYINGEWIEVLPPPSPSGTTENYVGS